MKGTVYKINYEQLSIMESQEVQDSFLSIFSKNQLEKD